MEWKIKLLIARMFGKKSSFIDDSKEGYCKVTGYSFKGTFYVTKIENNPLT